MRRFTGRSDSTRRQLYTDGRIYCDSIHRFKGQQAAAVILVDVDASLGDDTRSKAILYCGMTHATARLEVLVQCGNQWLPRLPECA